ncbi:MAG: DUF885 domain-containing protein [Candidatus Eisenbacteria sp.]|nr:DUF885 domain-containing protein [Candidatus Eisenbacteria bacterium]
MARDRSTVRRFMLCIPLLCLPAILAAGCGQNPDEAFDRLVDDFIQGYFAANPTTATSIGAHEFDAHLNNMSQEAIHAEIQRLHKFKTRIEAFPARKLDRDDRIDLSILSDKIDLDLLEMEEIQGWKNDPLLYTSIVGNGIHLLLARDFAPLEERLESAISRLGQIPELVDRARANLGIPAMIRTETAIRQNQGNIRLIEQDLMRAAEDAPAMKARLEEAAGVAAAALREFQVFLEEDLLPRSGGNFRLGPELHRRKLTLTCQSNLTHEEILKRAWEEFYSVRAEMYAIAQNLYGEYFTGRLPRGSGTAVEQQVVGKVLSRIADDHPNENNILPYIEQTLADLETFIREKDLLDLDDSQELTVTWMPEFSRGVAIAGLESPGPLEKHLSAFYYVMPIPEDWTVNQAESFFREYNNYMTQILTTHEAMPGHFVQIYHANRNPSLVRQIFGSGTFIEGWAVYTERMMVDSGYMDHDPRLKLQQLKFYLRTVINAILDSEVHSGQIPKEAVLDLLVNGGYQEESEAEGKWVRAQLTSAQLSTYFVGIQEVLDLRDSYREMKGDDFSLKEFHTAILAHGSPAPKYMHEILFGESRPD